MVPATCAFQQHHTACPACGVAFLDEEQSEPAATVVVSGGARVLEEFAGACPIGSPRILFDDEDGKVHAADLIFAVASAFVKGGGAAPVLCDAFTVAVEVGEACARIGKTPAACAIVERECTVHILGYAKTSIVERSEIHAPRWLTAIAGSPEDRRDRLLFLFAIAHALLTLLGAASEASELDRTLKVSTATHRPHSLYWQGNFWYRQLTFMRDDWFERLITAFDKIVREHEVFVQAVGIL